MCAPRLTWCGPYSLAVINEFSCYEANDRIKRALRVRRKLGRMWFQEVEKASRSSLFRFPLKFEILKSKKKPTLRNLGDYLKPHRLYMVTVSNHFVVINSSTMEVCDTFSRAWVHVDKHPYGRCFVHNFAEARRLETMEINREAIDGEAVNHDSNIDSTTAEEAVV